MTHPPFFIHAWARLLRFGFRLLYNEMAFTYDAVSTVVSLGQWHEWQRVALAYLPQDAASPGATVLELAHGTGTLQIDLRTAGLRPVALDLSRAMGRIASGKLRRWGWRPSLVRGRAQMLPFPSATFAAVVSTFPTEFIVAPETLREVRRVLIPGGRLVVVMSSLLTRGTIAERALETAYRVTGQRAPWPVRIEDRLADAGLWGEIVTHELEHSIVWLFLGDKDPSLPD